MKLNEFGYPSDEIGKVGYYDGDGNCLFVITVKKNSADFYYLYQGRQDGTLTRVDKAKDPISLVEKYHVEEIMRGDVAKQCKRTQEKAAETDTTRGTRKSAAKAKPAHSRRTV